jgi:3-hydroxy acid dehydrogenase / malonic semialdehyde reductase
VNNAGLSLGLNPINEGLDEDWNNMIDTNIKGLLYVSQIVMKRMIERKEGHIINIGSIAGIDTYSNNNIYCATKAAVISVTQTMRIDLLKYGIKVTLINPGAVETEFSLVRFKGNEQTAANVYKGFEPLTGADVADAIYYVSTLPPHVNINELTIVPNAQASPFYSYKKDD